MDVPHMKISLNHMIAPRLDHAAFFDLTRRLGLVDVEIRNDLTGVVLADGTPASNVGGAAKERGLAILSINALQRFNIWDDARVAEAAVMIAQCAASGAQALVLCPVNDVNYAPSAAERREALLKALNGLKPMLTAAGIRGFVEPLGFAECSLRYKEEAIEAISGADAFRVVHDTFHHYVSGETKIFPRMTGLVHISASSTRRPQSGRCAIRIAFLWAPTTASATSSNCAPCAQADTGDRRRSSRSRRLSTGAPTLSRTCAIVSIS
jgi:2-keto-myo-inositol isomerase